MYFLYKASYITTLWLRPSITVMIIFIDYVYQYIAGFCNYYAYRMVYTMRAVRGSDSFTFEAWRLM